MTNSTESPGDCSDSTENLKTETIEYLKKRGRQKLWAGSIAANKLQDEADRQRESQAHEARAARKAMGWDESPVEGAEVSDRQTILGDVTQSPPVVVIGGNENGSKPILGTIAAIALGMAIPGAGILGGALVKYLGDKAETTIVNGGKDTATTLGLKRITDLDIGTE